MQFEIKKRFSGEVAFTVELSAEYEIAARGRKLGAAIKIAVVTRADLQNANLSGAYLPSANLSGASGTDLSGTNLQNAYLSGTIEKYEVPIIPKIDAVILEEIEKGGTLEMGCWHGPEGWCGTTHCRAGWAVHCAGAAGHDLESKLGTKLAAAMIYHASRPGVPAPWFFAPIDVALADIKKCASEQTEMAENENDKL
jgi:uncharacterized protein YjbI with pentapeptide repeats